MDEERDINDEYEAREWYFCPECMSSDISPTDENIILDATEHICNQCKAIFILYD